MQVDEALRTRRSIRQFRDTPVPEAVVRDLLALAARAPSGGNMQPWFVDVVAGAARQRLCDAVIAKAQTGAREPVPFEVYPPGLQGVYMERRRKVGFDLYALMGVAREDKLGRALALLKNYSFFGAPVGLIVSMDPACGPAQFAHVGCFLQSFALAARARGLDTCLQEAWSAFPETVRGALGLPADRVVYCGIALGEADPDAAVNGLATEREPVEGFARLAGFAA